MTNSFIFVAFTDIYDFDLHNQILVSFFFCFSCAEIRKKKETLIIIFFLFLLTYIFFFKSNMLNFAPENIYKSLFILNVIWLIHTYVILFVDQLVLRLL
jgi:hypothetical protein